MYENFYGLKEKPFQMVPNPSYLYMSSEHENALTYLEYGLIENVGFILLTGEVGTSKTTLVRHIMKQFESCLPVVHTATTVNLSAFHRLNEFLFVRLIDRDEVFTRHAFECRRVHSWTDP